MSYFLIYLIKSTVYLALFYAFFMLAMRGNTFFRFNRWMLLLGTFVCMLLPCYTITVSEVEGIRLPMQVLDEMLVLEVPDAQVEDVLMEQISVQEVSTSAPVLPYLLLGIYAVGVLVYLTMVVRSFAEVWKLISRYPKQWKDGCWLVVVPKKIPSFSWGNYIVMSEEDYEDYPMVMAHERMHYRCRHTFDMLFFTVVHALHWFNPMVWLVRMELKQLHEFEADERVINQGIDATQYQILLVRKAVGKKLYTIANGFNHTKLKKRITMMIQKKSNGWERLKWLVTVPVVMGAMLVFAQPEVKDKLEEIAPVVSQQSTNGDIASLKNFFKEENRKAEDRIRRPDGTVVLHQSSVHSLHIKPNGEVVFSGQTLTTDYKIIIANHLREAKASDLERKINEPHAILMKYSAEAKEEIVLQVMNDIKAAFDILRSEYMAQGVKDVEVACPYRVVIEGPYKYFPDGVEITITSADGSRTEVLYENRWKKYKELREKYGKNAKVSFKVDKEASDWLFKRTDEHLKKLFDNVQGTKDGQNVSSTNNCSFKGVEVTIFDNEGKVLATVKDIKDLNELKEELKKHTVDNSGPYLRVGLKADKDTPMGDITEIKNVLRGFYVGKLNYEKKE